MKRRKLHLGLLAMAISACNVASAQLFIDQATFTIQTGATVTVQGDVTSNVDIQGAGKVILKGTANQNVNVGGKNIPNLEIDNAANVTFTGSAKVSGDLLFTNGNILLGNNNLSLDASPAGTITSAASTKFVVTNGTGRLRKAALGATAFNFPIGNALGAYDPISISNSGTADTIGARSFANVYPAGTTGTAFTKEVVNNSWDINEAVAGGSSLSITPTWNTADELPGFDRTRAGISYYIPTAGATLGWDLLNSQTSAATGANPYTYTRTGITTLGIFAVGTRPVLSPLLVSPKIFLQGAYNSTSGVMTEALRLANLIPLTEPYSSALGGSLMSTSNPTRGSGGGETSTASVIGSTAPASDNSIVDWVLVQLHTSAGVVVSQRAALLQRDGDVVDVDGVSTLSMAGNAPGTYYISVKHRNHLGARTANTLTLAKTSSTAYNFTDDLTKSFAGAVSNTALIKVNTITPAIYGLYSGNANSDLFTRKSGVSAINDYSLLLAAITATPGYYRTDFNLDSKVTKTGPNATLNDYSRLLTNFTGLATAVITQPTF